MWSIDDSLNTIREVCSRCPLAISADLLQDLTQYQKYHNKNVVMGARSLINLYRSVNPVLLAKRDKVIGITVVVY
jgi:protein SDA1